MPYKINASDVAALLGKNKYKTQEEIFEKIAIENNFIESKESYLLKEVQAKMQDEIADVIHSKSAGELETCMDIFERKTEDLILSDIVRRTMGEAPIFTNEIETSTEAKSAFVEVCKQSKNSVEALRLANNDPAVKKFMKESKEVKESVKSINTLRGQILEEKSTDAYQQTTNIPVKLRNSKCYTYTKNNWLIAGRVDGLTDDAVVETKTRRRFWKYVPEYDLVQLRCYMKLCNKQIGILNEQFPDGTSRETRIDWSNDVWNDIECELDKAMLKFEKEYVDKK